MVGHPLRRSVEPMVTWGRTDSSVAPHFVIVAEKLLKQQFSHLGLLGGDQTKPVEILLFCSFNLLENQLHFDPPDFSP